MTPVASPVREENNSNTKQINEGGPVKTPIEKKEPKEEIDDDIQEDAMPDQIMVDVDADFEPTDKKKYKQFEMIKLDTF